MFLAILSQGKNILLPSVTPLAAQKTALALEDLIVLINYIVLIW